MLPVKSLGSYDLSSFFKDDDGNPLTMSATSSFEGSAALSLPDGTLLTLPTWSSVAIAPTLMQEIGIYLISVTISDTIATASSTFVITVYNTAPYFASKVPADFTMKFNISYNYFIPKFSDKEGHDVTVLVDSIPSGKLYFATIINH